MLPLYTAIAPFNDVSHPGDFSWKGYLNWSKLHHLRELITLDRTLCPSRVQPDYENAEDWNNIHTHGQDITGLYTSPDYVLRKMETLLPFHFIRAVIEPDEDCVAVSIPDYDFIGYDLIDKSFAISALSNCGGFNESFLPADLNVYGLISDYTRAYAIKQRLRENNPEEYHADTLAIAIWRHKTIGPKQATAATQV